MYRLRKVCGGLPPACDYHERRGMMEEREAGECLPLPDRN